MSRPRILIAGIGNVFKGDDGFGVEVVRALMQTGLPDDVAVADFGIRGVDLAFAITDGCETAILVDAMPGGREPGSVSVIRPELADLTEPPAAVQGHNLDPLSVLRWANTIGGPLPDIYVVGCEPAVIPDDDELVEGLSPLVRAAVGTAVDLILNLMVQLKRSTSAVDRSESAVTSP